MIQYYIISYKKNLDNELNHFLKTKNYKNISLVLFFESSPLLIIFKTLQLFQKLLYININK